MGLDIDWPTKVMASEAQMYPEAACEFGKLQKIATDKWSFYDPMGSFYCQLHVIFHKI